MTAASDYVTDVRPVPTTLADLITPEWWQARNRRDQFDGGPVMTNPSLSESVPVADLTPASAGDGSAFGIVAYTADNPDWRYFEFHFRAQLAHPRTYEARGGESRAWDELIDPRRYVAFCEVRP